MNLRPFILSFMKAFDNTSQARREVIRWGERCLVCIGWVLGAVFHWWWLVLAISLLGFYSLVKTVRCAYILASYEDEEMKRLGKVVEGSLFDSVLEEKKPLKEKSTILPSESENPSGIAVGSMVRNVYWDSKTRIGRVARVYRLDLAAVQGIKGLPSKWFAEVEWPRPEGNGSSDLVHLEKAE